MRIIIILLAMAAMAVTAQGQSNTIPDMGVSDKFTWSPNLYFSGGITIFPDGKVKIDDGVKLDDASRAFWKGLERYFPKQVVSNVVIETTIVTNTVIPKQYKNNSQGCLVLGCRQDHSFWQDTPTYGWPSETRDNPDVRIIEVRRIKTITFEVDGQTVKVKLADDVISSKKMKRKVDIKEEWLDENSNSKEAR